jgi:hypothetical protein
VSAFAFSPNSNSKSHPVSKSDGFFRTCKLYSTAAEKNRFNATDSRSAVASVDRRKSNGERERERWRGGGNKKTKRAVERECDREFVKGERDERFEGEIVRGPDGEREKELER